MTSALLAGLAVWCLVVPRASHRIPRPADDRPPRTVPAPVVAAALSPLLGGLLLGWPWGAGAGLAAAPLAARMLGRLESGASRRRAELVATQLPVVLDLVSISLQAGRPPTVALRLAADAAPHPLRADLSAVAHRLEVAGDVRTALAEVPDSLVPLARALRRSEETGVPVAQVVDAVAVDLRRTQVAARREAARRVGVRATAPLGLCFLPAFFLIGIVPTVLALAGTLSF